MTSPGLDELFPGPTEMAALMRGKDWSTTSLGPPAGWPHSLKTIVRVLLTSRFAMWMGWGPDLTFFYNDAYAAMTLGAKHPWALGRPSREVWAEIWPEIGPRIERVLKTGDATWDEDLLLFLERSGYAEETYHTFSYSPVTDDGGRVCGHLCVVTEQTDRVIGERRMALLRDTATAVASINNEPQLFCALQDALNAGLRDLPFTLTYLLDQGGQQAHLVCHSGIAATHPGIATELRLDRPDEMWPLRDALACPDGLVVELANRIPGGAGVVTWDTAPMQALVLPIASPGQQRSGVFIAALNPFRPLDTSYRSFITLLVGQIAAGVSNAHAYQEERRRVEALAEIDRAKTKFFSNVSHEFRTPLTLMMGPLEDLLLKPQGQMLDDHRDAIAMVQRNGVRLLKLVNTLLDFSRIEAGRVRARFEPVDVCALTADLASTFRSAMERAGLDFQVTCVPFGEAVYVDRDMWEQIVLNLISNAFKFTLRGRVAVSVGVQSGRAVVAVEDTGTGIPQDQLPHVFDRFHRVEGSHGRSHEGSGIGLSLVHELVKLHGGDLTVVSEVGRGSTFTVSIPVGSAHVPPDQVVPAIARPVRRAAAAYAEEALRWLPLESGDSPRPEAAAVQSEERPAVAGHVLLADDNADMRDYARRLLSQRWSVEAVEHGAAALSAARARRPDVIVTDVMMPELDGFGLLRALRADDELRTIPVVLLSARAGEEARLEGLAASADDYLVKPFSARDLLGRVDAQILKSRTRAIERRHARRLTNLFAHAPVAIAVLRGPEHVYELANEHYIDVVGGRSVLGKSVREALPELEGQGIYELLDAVWRTGEPYIGESLAVMLNRGPNAEPEQAFFDFVYQPVFDERGAIETIVVVAHDVTALATAKQEAETANRLKDEFLATLSHELRTPLNAVLGYTQMLRGGVIAVDRIPSILETIERNARLQEQLVSDVLDVSRIITGKLRLDIRPVNLAGVIQSAIETVAPAAAAKGVRLQPTLDHPGMPVAGDAQRLQQVVWNLLSNAVKFTPRNGRVQVRLQRVNSHAEIVVSDTGEGIAPEFLPRLFQRFQQADGTFTRPHSGLGLGLAISRHLVEAHGGHIEATSPGKGLGTTVRVELPLMIVHDQTVASPDRVHPSADANPSTDLTLPDLTDVRVLLVDDDVDALHMANDALTAAMATVVAVSSAQQALEAVDRATFDVLVFDIGMPDVDGYQLLTRIRGNPDPRRRTMPAIALTAYARSLDRTRSLKTGFQMHLSKPVQPTELAAAVLALAGDRRAPSPHP
jgi:signal transduction histidine kinase/DNA-binding response OmpR family regulator